MSIRKVRKIRTSILIAMGLAGLAITWILSGQFASDGNSSTTDVQAPASAPAETVLATVRTMDLSAQTRGQTLSVTGRSEASRQVELRAETAGQVAKLQARRGDRIKENAVIASLRLDDRQARLAEAMALLKQREIEFQAAQKLHEKGFRSTTAQAAAEAQLDAARAVVEQIEIDIERTQIRAPFDGIVGAGHIELGGYVGIGDTVAMLVDLDPILIVGSVSERQIGALKVGELANVRLVDGVTASGTIRFIAPVADQSTRTYRIEIEVPNPDHRIRDGLTAEIAIGLDNTKAHFVPPSSLTLNDEGTVGVRCVDENGVVKFYPVNVLEDQPSGIWLTGLPDRVQLIVVGQEFVIDGERVKATPVAAAAKTEPAS